MIQLTVTQLEEELVKASELLRGINASERLNLISEVLILKRASDQPGILIVPEPARWSHIAHSGESAVYVLNEALRQLERSNPIALDGVLEGIDYSRRLSSAEAEALIRHFDRISLRDDDLEFSFATPCVILSVPRSDHLGRAAGAVTGGSAGAPTYAASNMHVSKIAAPPCMVGP